MKNMKSSQEGVMLLEALIGILIFSIGILALVAMQANAISNVSNAQYRADASALADEILAQIQMDYGVGKNGYNTLPDVNLYAYSGGLATHPPLAIWVARVKDRLPRSDTPEAYPTIEVTNVAIAGSIGAVKQVRVTVRWRAPTATSVSNHVAIGTVSGS
jgi:type IV pilus assembly protein PilV